jgi:hypothetical protein
MTERRPWDADASAKLSTAERQQLERVLKRREKESDESADEVKAQRIADFEEEIATIFAAESEAFADVTALAQEVVAKANAEIDHRCDELNIRRAFRPRLRLGWVGRGENDEKERRAELRRVAEKRAEADKLAAKKVIRRTFTDQLELLALGVLASEEAQKFLEQAPRPEALMPDVKLAELNVGDAKTPRERWSGGSVPLLALGEGNDPSEPEDDEPRRRRVRVVVDDDEEV